MTPFLADACRPNENRDMVHRASLLRWIRVLALTVCNVTAGLHSGLAIAADDAPRLVGRVFKVTDGDTIEVQLASGPINVRFDSIDAPESNQPHGAQAKAALTRLVLDKTVELEVIEQDRYERLVAIVYAGNDSTLNVNRKLVDDGHAWAYRRYLKKAGGEGAAWCRAEDYARRNRRGLWALKPTEWIFPPDWRRWRRNQTDTVTDYSRETAANCIAAIGKR